MHNETNKQTAERKGLLPSNLSLKLSAITLKK